MRDVWGNFWLRIVISLVVAPFAMTIAFLVTMDILAVVGLWQGNRYAFSHLFPPLSVLLFIAFAAEVAIWPPLIGVEINNRRHKDPVEPLHCLLFALIMAACLSVAVIGVVLLDMRYNFGGKLFIVPLMLVCAYIAAVIAALLIVLPIVRRWRARQVDVKQAEQIF